MVNKLRTILSLLGITIGIFTIISVLTVFDSVERTIRTNIESLGDNVLYIQKFSWLSGDRESWMKYMNRPAPTINDMETIQRKSQCADAVAYLTSTTQTIQHLNNSIEDVSILAISQDYDKTTTLNIADGRYFSELESAGGKNVAIIGSYIAENLFSNTEPLAKEIKIWGRKIKVIGVLKKQGTDMFGNNPDNEIILPVNYMRNIIDIHSQNIGINAAILVKTKASISNSELGDELTGILRSEHRLKPFAEDDFSINEPSMAVKIFESIFSTISKIAWLIGGFSILVGGFGIANIMFVSVKERTSIIGIQKSLGAKRYFILFEFLFEAIILSLIGGIVGLLIVFAGTQIVSVLFDLKFTLGLGNIMMGIITSGVIGIIAGFIPAWTASRLNPVEAIRANQ